VSPVAQGIVDVMIWGMIAALATISVMYASQSLGWTRLNLPFLLGAMFTEDRRAANVLGFLLYLVVGWLIAFFYTTSSSKSWVW